ncbi:MAG: hypothetical protein Q9194_006159 [Teloschistes cf. exilis]
MLSIILLPRLQKGVIECHALRNAAISISCLIGGCLLYPHHSQNKGVAAPDPNKINLSPPGQSVFLQPTFQRRPPCRLHRSIHPITPPRHTWSRILGSFHGKNNCSSQTPYTAQTAVASPPPLKHSSIPSVTSFYAHLIMPYNTRRKSLSLPSLGIHLPSSSRAHRPSISKVATTAESSPQPPTKKVKRSHTSDDASPTIVPRPRSNTASSATKSVSFAAERPKSSGRAAYEHTPPPSPGATNRNKIDLDGIHDDIVCGVIEQLEKTGNRPHLIKELATVLSTTNDSVLGSANPTALLSSRLTAYIRRDCWSPLSPCPLAKELIPVHPRKVFYYLTTQPRQEIPADSSDIFAPALNTSVRPAVRGGKRIISPSLSNASVEDDDSEAAEIRKREAFSQSPEIDLSVPELDTVTQTDDHFHTSPTPPGPLSGRSSLARDGSIGSIPEDTSLAHNHRAQSPPLEGDEKEFTQTASNMRMRGMSFDDQSIRQSTEVENALPATVDGMHLGETEEEVAHRDQEDGATLFGEQHGHTQEVTSALMSSPLVKPIRTCVSMERVAVKDAASLGEVEMREESISILGQHQAYDWEIREPESVQLDELDDLLGDF